MSDIIFGEGLLGEDIATKKQGNLADRFLIPPFSVLSARDIWWQNRKRAWIGLGIKSELGRGGLEEANANPGGSLNYSNRERCNSTGKAIAGTEATVTASPKIIIAAPPAKLPSARNGVGKVSVAAALNARPAPAQTVVVAAPRALRIQLASAKPLGPAQPDPFLLKNANILKAAGIDRIKFEEHNWFDPVPTSLIVFLDIEVFTNFFVVCLKRPDGRRAAFEMSDRCPLDMNALRMALRGATVVTFNGASYDIPILMMALRGDDILKLKDASNRIISQSLKSWQSEKEFGVRLPQSSNHIDMIELCVHASLKVLYGRLHGKILVDLPFDPDAYLSERDMNIATLYCMNDLDATEALWNAMADRIALRESMGRACGLDLRSESDAQMGEAIVRRNIETTRRVRITKPNPNPMTFRYRVPEFIRFSGTEMQKIITNLASAEFHANSGGDVEPPAFLKNTTVRIGDAGYAMGIGGLHSQEVHRSLVSNDNYQLVDVDVSSHYPRIILHLGMCPPAAGQTFLDVYRSLMDERLAAKAAGNKAKSDGAKIALNGCFGKLGSPYSFLYAPDILAAVTLTGQLSILMLIEQAEEAGIRVVSANTDGVLFYCPRGQLATLDDIITDWETTTEFGTEKTNYRAIYSSSVNSYFAVKEDGKVKRKGPIADPWKENDLRSQMSKNPQMLVCGEAVERLIVDDLSLEDTIRACNDPRAFITLIRVNGGATWRGKKLGRVVRYYWSTDGEPISYVNANRKVAKTDGAKPMMELPDNLPDDIDFDRYLAEATKIAREFAVITDAGILLK